MRIVATAPVRTADVGGWTDTWFATSGIVCSVAIEPGVTVTVDAVPGPSGQVRLEVPATRIDVTFDTGSDPASQPTDALLLAALRTRSLPFAVHVRIESGVPPGSGLGTSASVTVALLAAMDAAVGVRRDPHALACAAHQVETGLGLQSGVQDQFAAAFGHVHRYDVEYPYGGAIRSVGDERVLDALDARLLTVYLGRPHASSALHELVIASLEGVDNEAVLAPIRAAARRAAAALDDNDMAAYGRAMIEGNAAMARLHRDLVCDDARRVIHLAEAHGAIGWKVNGAGGDGGSVAVLGPPDQRRHEGLVAALERDRDLELLPCRVARRGVRVAVD